MDNVTSLSALYLHIPFCVKKCGYCCFNSIQYDHSTVDAYIDVIEKEITLIKNKYVFNSIYIGGGTPTVLDKNQLKRLLQAIKVSINQDSLMEFTVEANPGTVCEEKINILRENLVNRVSLGAQSFNPTGLKTLGRIHTREQTVQTYSLLRSNGFTNISLDLIFGLPSQSSRDWEDDLLFTISLGPEHVSTYSLTYEDGTTFSKNLANGIFKKISGEDELNMYKLAIDLLKGSGYKHYEISNFAKKGKDSRHNKVYWENREYLGIGAGAHSFINGKRSANECNVPMYIKNARANKSNTIFFERLNAKDYAAETIIMGLRVLSGLPKDRFQRQTGYSYAKLFKDEIATLKDNGYIHLDNNRLALTEKGLYIADSVMMEFLN